MYLKFWGTRGSIPAPGKETIKYGGNTSCIEIRTDNILLIIDAGSGIRELGNFLLKEFKRESITGHIFLSHTHWDHIQGIPFFTPAYIPDNKFTLYGPRGTDLGIENVVKQQLERDFFPVPFSKMKSSMNFVELEKGLVVGGAEIKHYVVNHPGVSYGYRITLNGKVIVYTGDNEPKFQKVKKVVDNDEIIDVVTETDSGLVEFVRDADVVIGDSQYTPKEYKNSRAGWGHSSYLDVINLAVKGNAKQLVLFHHDPTHSDDFIDGIVRSARDILKEKNSDIVCEGAKEGMVIEF